MSNKTTTIELSNTNIFDKEIFDNSSLLYAIEYNRIRIFTVYVKENCIELHRDKDQLIKAMESYYDKAYSLIELQDRKLAVYLFLCNFRADLRNFLQTISEYIINL